jgi:hypothetical protein
MSTEIKSHKGYPRSSTSTLLIPPKHRSDYRTNADVEISVKSQTSSPQGNASVRYPVGGIFIGSPLPLSGSLQGVAKRIDVTSLQRSSVF